MSDLVCNPEDRFSHNEAHLIEVPLLPDISLPREVGVTGEPLPSPRTVSNVVHRQDPCCPMQESDLSLYVMQWGQMMDHDITDTAIAKGKMQNKVMYYCE